MAIVTQNLQSTPLEYSHHTSIVKRPYYRERKGTWCPLLPNACTPARAGYTTGTGAAEEAAAHAFPHVPKRVRRQRASVVARGWASTCAGWTQRTPATRDGACQLRGANCCQRRCIGGWHPRRSPLSASSAGGTGASGCTWARGCARVWGVGFSCATFCVSPAWSQCALSSGRVGHTCERTRHRHAMGCSSSREAVAPAKQPDRVSRKCPERHQVLADACMC